MASRREANRKMTLAMFVKNLKMLFPEIEDLPHNDTLMGLLERIDVSEIEKAQLELVRSLIRKSNFFRIVENVEAPKIAITCRQPLIKILVRHSCPLSCTFQRLLISMSCHDPI